jgi:hypothetical protein
MNSSASTSHVTGATLRADAACYVQRQADKELLAGLLAGEFCYMLSARPMTDPCFPLNRSLREGRFSSKRKPFMRQARGSNGSPSGAKHNRGTLARLCA